MDMMRRKKMYPKDVESYTVQKNLNNRCRLARVASVNPSEGTCTLQYVDYVGGFAYDVIVSQGSRGEWHMPKKGDVLVTIKDVSDQTRIVGYINFGQAQRVQQTKTLPKLKEGEKFWEAGGTYIHIDRAGNFEVSTPSMGSMSLEAATGVFKTETVDWKIATEAGTQYFGLVKRATLNLDGTKSVEIIEGDTDEYLTEYRFKLVEIADGGLGVSTEDPLVDIGMGTIIDDDGNPVDKNGLPTTWESSSALCINMVVKKSGTELLTLTLSKGGELNISVSDVLNINGGTNGVARKEDATLVNSSTDSAFTTWMSAVDAFCFAAADPGSLATANGVYKAAVPSGAPSDVTGKINEGSETVKVGD